MNRLFLLEPDSPGAAWAPFTCARPIAELRAGIWRIRERWEAAVQADTAAILGTHVEGFTDADEPACRELEALSGPAVIAASWFAPSGAAVPQDENVRRLTHEGSTVAWVVPEGEAWERSDGGEALEIDGMWLRGSYDLIGALERFLADDCADFRAAPHSPIPDRSIVLGEPGSVFSLGAVIEPGVVFDVRQGSIVLEEGSEVRHGTRLEGPLYIGERTKVLGGHIRNSVIGPECRVHGEVASTVFLGFSNKSHDGFLGHSVIGRWVNLGAGTTTSNLKNTYGTVRLDVAGERIETGRLNLGTLFGDHAKTAIGTMLPTGTVVSVGANVFGSQTTPKYVPPFAWGSDGVQRLTEDGFLRIAERVMQRRNVVLSPERRDSLSRTYARCIR